MHMAAYIRWQVQIHHKSIFRQENDWNQAFGDQLISSNDLAWGLVDPPGAYDNASPNDDKIILKAWPYGQETMG